MGGLAPRSACSGGELHSSPGRRLIWLTAKSTLYRKAQGSSGFPRRFAFPRRHRGGTRGRHSSRLSLAEVSLQTTWVSFGEQRRVNFGARRSRAKGGVKAHVLLDHDDYLPSYVLITDAKQSDVRVAQSLDLNAGSIVAMDRGYNDYALFGKWTGQGVFFVTRLKDKAVYEVTESIIGPLPRNIVSDETIRLTGPQAIKDCPHLLRRVVVWDEPNQREIDLLTNQRQFGPTTIAAIYKDRWEIELFFKALKQNLKVKSFVGTSKNALLIQIWTALIAIMLLKWLHHLSKAKWSLSNLASMLRLNLFTYRNLLLWLDNPFGTPPLIPVPVQFSLELN